MHGTGQTKPPQRAERRQGLSKTETVPSLLKINPKRNVKQEQEEDVSRPPDASSDDENEKEDEKKPAARKSRWSSDSIGSSLDSPPLSIKKTNFSSKTAPSRPSRQQPARTQPARSSALGPTTGAKRKASDPGPSSFPRKRTELKRPPKTTTTYSSKQPTKLKETFQLPSRLLSDPSDRPEATRSLRRPSSPIPSSPEETPKLKKRLNVATNSKNIFISSQSSSARPSPLPYRTARPRNTAKDRRLNRKRRTKSPSPRSPSPPPLRTKLIIPPDIEDDVEFFKSCSQGSTLLSSPLSSPGLSSKFAMDDDDEPEEKDEPPVCPLCRIPISAELLATYKKSGIKTLAHSVQSKICQIHRTQTAKDTWASKGYPEIDWDNFESRIGRYDRLARGLFQGTTESEFADALAEKVRTGQERTLLAAKGSVTPGYYGPRGLRLMSEIVMRRYSKELRRWGVENRLVSARGNMGFVQAVVVPEITVRWIMEDMNLGRKRARVVYEESREAGDLVHEDLGDTILSDGEDEEADGNAFVY